VGRIILTWSWLRPTRYREVVLTRSKFEAQIENLKS